MEPWKNSACGMNTMWVMDHPEDTELLRALFAGMYDDLPAKSR